MLSVPLDPSYKIKAIMKDCMCKAGLIEDFNSKKLQFIKESKLHLYSF